MTIRMDQLVRWSDGTIATPRQLLDTGRGEIKVHERFAARARSTPRRAVFVDLKGTTSGVEVSGYTKR
jgi:hypothetical protein